MSAAFDADGQPTPAALGFAKKQGVAFEQLTRVTDAEGRVPGVSEAPARQERRRRAAGPAGGVLRDLTFPKQMHWDATLEDGQGELLFGRPIRWLLFLYGGRVVPFTIGRDSGEPRAPRCRTSSPGALTYGHRFLATSGRAGRSIKVRSFDEYQARLTEHFVVLDHAERRDRIAPRPRDARAAARRPRRT